MGVWSRWKRTTFEGKIKREIGEISSSAMKVGGMSIQVQELEKSLSSYSRRFRLNVVYKASLTHQSMPIVLEEIEIRKFINLLESALENIEN